MLDGLADEEVDRYLKDNPRIVPLFEIDVVKAATMYMPNPKTARELRQTQEALEKEMVVY